MALAALRPPTRAAPLVNSPAILPVSSQSTSSSHAQFAEDLGLARIFEGRDAGVCLEVGAFDGITGSATYAFERRGWTAVLVEPLPEMAALIRERRKGPLFNVAAGDADGRVRLGRALRDPAISTVADDPWHRELRALRGETMESVEVDQLTLDTILARAGVDRVDFATIDVEGHELAVLRGWDLARWRPRVIIIEDNSRGLDESVPARLAAGGYVCFRRTGVNDWYAHGSDPLATPPARLRVAGYRAWRKARARLRHLVPSRLKSFARARGWLRA